MDDNTYLAILVGIVGLSITIIACFKLWIDYKQNKDK